MVKVVRVLALPLALLLCMWTSPAAEAATSLPGSIASVGDSITRAYDVCCWYGDHAEDPWSTGGQPERRGVQPLRAAHGSASRDRGP